MALNFSPLFTRYTCRKFNTFDDELLGNGILCLCQQTRNSKDSVYSKDHLFISVILCLNYLGNFYVVSTVKCKICCGCTAKSTDIVSILEIEIDLRVP